MTITEKMTNITSGPVIVSHLLALEHIARGSGVTDDYGPKWPALPSANGNARAAMLAVAAKKVGFAAMHHEFCNSHRLSCHRPPQRVAGVWRTRR